MLSNLFSVKACTYKGTEHANGTHFKCKDKEDCNDCSCLCLNGDIVRKWCTKKACIPVVPKNRDDRRKGRGESLIF